MSTTNPRSIHTRGFLTAAVCLTTLVVVAIGPARAQGVPPPTCVVSPVDGSVVNCTGNQSAGINLNDGSGPFRTLNVFALTTDIAPASGFTGVVFTSNGAVSVNVDPGPFAIIATDANGIFASSNGGAVTITSTASIIAPGASARGIEGSALNALLKSRRRATSRRPAATASASPPAQLTAR